MPKTIDNDLNCTDVTFGFDTSINIVTEAIDRIRTTAESHRRVLVVETMGRHAGWIACYSAMATGADYLLVPEKPVDLDDMCRVLQARRAAVRGTVSLSSPKGPNSRKEWSPRTRNSTTSAT